ncbi:MAG: outer membrane protein assembly factor BamE [Planctomycetota bacterium]
MSWRGLGLGLLLICAAPGCFVSRNTVDRPLDPEAIEEVKVGKTTKEQVVTLLGAPTDIIFSNKALDPLRAFAYEYSYSVTKTSGLTLIVITFLNSDTKRDHVLVFFDDDGVVSAIGSRLNAEFASYGLPFGD